MVAAKRGIWAFWIAVILVVPLPAQAAVTKVDQNGTTLLDGRKVFPIVLAKGPPPGSSTPRGADALDEVVAAGVNVIKVGPSGSPWTDQDLAGAIVWNRAAAARGIYTWVNLSSLSQAVPGTPHAVRLREVIAALERDRSGRAIALWKGADEVSWSGFPPSTLQFAYCLATARGDPAWCAGDRPVDDEHLWVTIQAPRGSVSELAPYSEVTDVHGINRYPVTLDPNPDLHEVGRWTATVAAVTPNRAVWTTLQVCGLSSYDSRGLYILPTKRQLRYMAYDAILNGARNLAFYGGNIFRCWTEADKNAGWNWTFWNSGLEDVIRELSAKSPLAPALVNPGTTRLPGSSSATTQVISRQGRDERELWVIAARHGRGEQLVTISGLPLGVTSGSVYREGRTIPVVEGVFVDTFKRWDVHVYRFAVPDVAQPENRSPERRRRGVFPY